jgi:excisionase family DNA binding protein
MFGINEPTYSVTETAKIIGVDRSTVYRLINDHKIKTIHGRPIRIKTTDIQSYILTIAPKASELWKFNPLEQQASII